VLSEHIEQLVNDLIGREDLFLVDVLISGGEGNRKIAIYLDGDEGISIDDCTELSRKISDRLDADDMIEGKYVLEVSSHGLERPLKMKRQFQKNIGRDLHVLLTDSSTRDGRLTFIDDHAITLDIPKKGKSKKNISTEKVTVPFDSIKFAKVSLSL